jgi:hypothetical protein
MKILLGLNLLLGIALGGCATNRDYVSTIEIRGRIDAQTRGAVTLSLVDTGLDYVRSIEKNVFHEVQILDNEINTSASYHWGTKGGNKFSRAFFEVRISSANCQQFVRQVEISSLSLEQNSRLLDLGTVVLECTRD